MSTAVLPCNTIRDELLLAELRVQSGHDIFTIARLLGHEQIETTKEYMSPSMNQLREAIEDTMRKDENGTIPTPEGYEERRARLCGIR